MKGMQKGSTEGTREMPLQMPGQVLQGQHGSPGAGRAFPQSHEP